MIDKIQQVVKDIWGLLRKPATAIDDISKRGDLFLAVFVSGSLIALQGGEILYAYIRSYGFASLPYRNAILLLPVWLPFVQMIMSLLIPAVFIFCSARLFGHPGTFNGLLRVLSYALVVISIIALFVDTIGTALVLIGFQDLNLMSNLVSIPLVLWLAFIAFLASKQLFKMSNASALLVILVSFIIFPALTVLVLAVFVTIIKSAMFYFGYY